LLPFAVTAGEAIGDLPFIHGESVRRGTRKFDTVSEYRRSGCSVYAKSMREWPGFTSLIGVRDHVIRFLPRDGRTFSAMAEGDEYPAAHATALRLLDAEAARLGIQKGSLRYRELLDRMVPPYDVAKFPNRWWKIRRDFPVRTLMAHIGKDTYSHIHYDGAQARTISVREAARLQSFPDGFVFAGSMNAAFRQIGNAVPPLMAFAMAQAIRGLLEESAGRVSGLAPATPQVAAAA
jgi:DNA (cytosine-5)-methyltransferase 1